MDGVLCAGYFKASLVLPGRWELRTIRLLAEEEAWAVMERLKCHRELFFQREPFQNKKSFTSGFLIIDMPRARGNRRS